MSSKTEMLNPEKLIMQLFKVEGLEGKEFKLRHIHYSEALNDDYDYQIIRESSHDGTHLFTYNLLAKTLENIVNKWSYCNKDITEQEFLNLKDIEYEIGDIKLETTYGKIEVPAGKIAGVTQVASLPVRCKYIFS